MTHSPASNELGARVRGREGGCPAARIAYCLLIALLGCYDEGERYVALPARVIFAFEHELI